MASQHKLEDANQASTDEGEEQKAVGVAKSRKSSAYKEAMGLLQWSIYEDDHPNCSKHNGPIIDKALKEEAIGDDTYVMPPFQLRTLSENEKLKGTENFKKWFSTLESDLLALGLLPVIKSKNGDSAGISSRRWELMNAQTLLHIKFSISSYDLWIQLTFFTKAYDVVRRITEIYGRNTDQHYMYLYEEFQRLRFKKGFDQRRFVKSFEDIIEKYEEQGIVFSNAFLKSAFLSKIDELFDSTSPFYKFYFSLTFPTEDAVTLGVVKRKFLEVRVPKTSN